MRVQALALRRTFNLPRDPAAQTHAFGCRAQSRLAMQLWLGAQQNLAVERAGVLLACRFAVLQMAVNPFAEGPRQFPRRRSIEVDHIFTNLRQCRKTCFPPDRSQSA